MKNIIKANQVILSVWEKPDNRDRVTEVNWRGVKHMGVVVNGGTALIAVPEELSPFSFDALAQRLEVFNMQTILDGLLNAQEEAIGELSGLTEKTDGRTLVQVVGGERSAWFDQKLVKLFGPSPSFRFYKGHSSLFPVFSPSGVFLVVLCPVVHKKERATT